MPSDKVIIDGHHNENHVEQARAEAGWIRSKLEKLTGKKFPIRSVLLYLLYPGWFVDGMTKERKKGDIWAFKPENFRLYTDGLPDVITPEDIMLATDRIASLARGVDLDKNGKLRRLEPRPLFIRIFYIPMDNKAESIAPIEGVIR